MGKAKKLKHLSKVRNVVSLDEQILTDATSKVTGRVKQRREKQPDEVAFVDSKLSHKILSEARKQQQELEDEFGVGSSTPVAEKKLHVSLKPSQSDKTDAQSESDNDNLEDEEETYFEDIQVNEEDERALSLFMNKNETKQRTLADIIEEKLKEKETEIQTQFSDAGSMKVSELDPRVVELYRGVRTVLSRYRSGKLPKAFKIIPALANWEQVLQITEPDKWTAATMYQATRIFIANLKEKMAQRFFNLILLPRIRDDLAEYKHLNFHLYQALRKALFKPGAFFKGIVLPLCEAGNCTLREAVVIGSVTKKHRIPLLHACAAMLKIAEMDYSGANSVFLHNLIEKRYALPYRVIDGLVYHFLKFTTDKRELSVLWHQCLLVFVENYKQDLSSEQKEALMELLRVQYHHQITPEIRNQLVKSRPRDEEVNVEMQDDN